MTAPSFERTHPLVGWSYSTPAGQYTIVGAVGPECVWQLSNAGKVVGSYPTVEDAEAALDADVKKRMWN